MGDQSKDVAIRPRKWMGDKPKDILTGTGLGLVGPRVGTGTAMGVPAAPGGLSASTAVGPKGFLTRRCVVGVELASDTMVAVTAGHHRRPRWWNEGQR